jgi:hypothetical protein
MPQVWGRPADLQLRTLLLAAIFINQLPGRLLLYFRDKT